MGIPQGRAWSIVRAWSLGRGSETRMLSGARKGFPEYTLLSMYISKAAGAPRY